MFGESSIVGSLVEIGSGDFKYNITPIWAKPTQNCFWRDVAGVAVDSKDRVYIFSRGSDPVTVFDNNGNFLNSWGENLFHRPHAITAAPDDTLYCTDDWGHTVRHCSPDGKVLMTIGTQDVPSAPHSGIPFNQCTDVAINPNTGYIYVTDGYRNSAVHKYSPDGKLLVSWGKPGTDPGEFNIVHNICIDNDGYVYVADRENHRIQIFDSNGKFETQWANMHRPSALHISNDQYIYVGELGYEMQVNSSVPNIGPKISIYNKDGKRLAQFGDPHPGFMPGQFYAPHSICLNSKNDLFLGEVDWTYSRSLGEPRDEVRGIQKLNKIT